MTPTFSVLIGGILPFGAVFIELFFILTSMWLHQVYYIFGILFLVYVILVITCAEITIVLCYFQLCSEDYHWWCVHVPPLAISTPKPHTKPFPFVPWPIWEKIVATPCTIKLYGLSQSAPTQRGQ